MTYQQYWGLQKLPFGRPESADDFFPGRPQREASARMDYLIRGGRGHGLLIALPGTGQSSLLRRTASSAGFGDTAVDTIYCADANRPRLELQREMLSRLGAARVGTDIFREIRDRIAASGRAGVRTVWLVDNATSTAAHLAGLLGDASPWFTAILGTSPQRALAIAAALRGCSLRIDLEPFELSDTNRYIVHQLKAAGGRRSLFTDAAMVRLHELSEGRVATIARLAELALPLAAGQQATHVHVDAVEAVQNEIIRAAAA